MEGREGYCVVIWMMLGSWTLVPIVKGVFVAFKSISRCAIVTSTVEDGGSEMRAITSILWFGVLGGKMRSM